MLRPRVERDYKSFSSAAKSRFRPMSEALGYEQITGVVYVKLRDGWYETFNLQSSQYGNPLFYINYGVILPKEWPATREALRGSGWRLGKRLPYNNEGRYPCATKQEIVESAAHALEAYRRIAVPWFDSLTLNQIKET